MPVLANKQAILAYSKPTPDWKRPSDWLPMPTVTDTEQKFVGLHGVWEKGDNVVAFLFRGAYTVDWGDGVVENVADNVKAEHQYTWASIPAGTTTSQGYRQVIITVTPNGGNLTSCNFQQRYTGRNQVYSTGFLDVTLSMPNASAGASIVFGGGTVTHSNVERATVLTIGGATNMANMFNACYSLQSVPLFNTSAVTTMGSMFGSCFSLQSVPLFNTAAVTTMANMFFSCYSLQSVPLFNTAAVTNMGSMFQECRSLQSVPLFNTAAVTTMASMFQNCNSLQSVPLFNTAVVTNMVSMFFNCRSLQSIPAISTASITTTTGTDFGATFSENNRTLARCEMIFARTVGFGTAGLGAPALVEIFTNLVDRSATTAATITITGNWGAPLLTTEEREIATSKNWTITG
jgi:surface protein